MNELRTQHCEDVADEFFNFDKINSMFYITNNGLYLRMSGILPATITAANFSKWGNWIITRKSAYEFPTLPACDMVIDILKSRFPNIEIEPIPTANQQFDLDEPAMPKFPSVKGFPKE